MNLEIAAHIGDDDLSQAPGSFGVYPSTEKRRSVGRLLRFHGAAAEASKQNNEGNSRREASKAQFANRPFHFFLPCRRFAEGRAASSFHGFYVLSVLPA